MDAVGEGEQDPSRAHCSSTAVSGKQRFRKFWWRGCTPVRFHKTTLLFFNATNLLCACWPFRALDFQPHTLMHLLGLQQKKPNQTNNTKTQHICNSWVLATLNQLGIYQSYTSTMKKGQPFLPGSNWEPVGNIQWEELMRLHGTLLKWWMKWWTSVLRAHRLFHNAHQVCRDSAEPAPYCLFIFCVRDSWYGMTLC